MKLTIGAAEVELTDKDVARFWSKVDRRGDDECWEWKARHRHEFGYGVFSVGKLNAGAHRVAYAIGNDNPGSMLVCHECDNPACCNPRHLFAGSIDDNNKDKHRKGRALGAHKGGGHHNAKLNEDAVSSIKRLRRLGVKQAEVASMFGVNRTLVSMIENGRRWGHVV